MEDLHRELAGIAFAAGADLGLMLAGGYAIRAHGLTERPSGDLDLATAAAVDLTTVIARLSESFRRSGFEVRLIESKPRMARLEVTRGTAVCGYSWPDLERLGARHTPNWSLADLADRLSAIDLRDDGTFAAYGLTEDEIDELRRWTQSWADDIQFRLATGAGAVPEPPVAADWDAYLGE